MSPLDDCDACTLESARGGGPSARSYTVFIVTFLLITVVALTRILSKGSSENEANGKALVDARLLPLHNYDLGPSSASMPKERCQSILTKQTIVKRLMYMTFAMNIGLSAVLVELLLCEISNILEPKARSFALSLVLPALLLSLVLVSPAVHILNTFSSTGLASETAGKGRLRITWLFESISILAWLSGFWYVGKASLDMYLRAENRLGKEYSSGLVQGCLERIGVIGITLMATLSGFAAVSAVWQTFLIPNPTVTDAEINRKQAGLEAIEEMLEVKRSRLRTLEKKMSDVSSHGVFSTVVSTLKGNSDVKDRSMLAMEIKGLESMRVLLMDQLHLIKSRKEEQEQKLTSRGQLLDLCSTAFACYCIVRLASVSFGFLRRLSSRYPTSTSDPVTVFLSIMTKSWDPHLNQVAWARQVSFLFSGFMLLAAFNSAFQTSLLLGRAIPGLAISAAAFREATVLALLISQFVATYVISAALLLRSSLPKDVSSVISDALGAPLEPSRVDAWFEACFIIAAILTAVGTWISGKIRHPTDEDDGIGLGKMN